MTKRGFYIGLDVHKRQTTYAVRDWDGKLAAEGSCHTSFQDLYTALEPYLVCGTVAMEPCVSYYQLYLGFKKKGIDTRVANVTQIRKLVGKNDKLDAKRLADMLRLNTLPRAFVPEEHIHQMRSMVNLRHRFVQENVRLKNQIHANLDTMGVSMGTRTPFCKTWCRRLQQYIADNECVELKHLLEAYQMIQARIQGLTVELLAYAKKHYSKEFTLLQTIPGFGEIFAAYLISQIMPVSRFDNVKKLRRYAGVVPVSNWSDNNLYCTYLPKASSRPLLRYALVEGAQSALKTKSRIKDYFKKKKKNLHRNQAVMCVAASLCDIVYQVLTSGKPYAE